MTDLPNDLLQKIKPDPLGPEKMLEYINRVDQQVAELREMLDAMGTDLIKLHIVSQAIQSILVSNEIVTPEDLQSNILQASEQFTKQSLMQPEGEDEINDIKV